MVCRRRRPPSWSCARGSPRTSRSRRFRCRDGGGGRCALCWRPAFCWPQPRSGSWPAPIGLGMPIAVTPLRSRRRVCYRAACRRAQPRGRPWQLPARTHRPSRRALSSGAPECVRARDPRRLRRARRPCRPRRRRQPRWTRCPPRPLPPKEPLHRSRRSRLPNRSRVLRRQWLSPGPRRGSSSACSERRAEPAPADSRTGEGGAQITARYVATG
jgi:hypothetical protein